MKATERHKEGLSRIVLTDARVVATLTTRRAEDVVGWCRRQGVTPVGIDAPCRWSLTGWARACERELAGLGILIWCAAFREHKD